MSYTFKQLLLRENILNKNKFLSNCAFCGSIQRINHLEDCFLNHFLLDPNQFKYCNNCKIYFYEKHNCNKNLENELFIKFGIRVNNLDEILNLNFYNSENYIYFVKEIIARYNLNISENNLIELINILNKTNK